MKVIITIASWLLASSLALAQDTRVPVAVSHSGEDPVGQRLAFALKEAIRGSGSFRFVDHEAAATFPRIVVYLTSVNAGTELASAIAETLAYDSVDVAVHGILIMSGVQYCDRIRVEAVAKGMLSDIDRSIEYLRKYYPDLWRSLITRDDRYSAQRTPDAFSDDALPARLPAVKR